MAGLLLAGTAQAQTPAPAGGKAELQWFAQSAFKLTTPGGKVIMIDPWLTANPKTPPEFKDLDKLGKIDLTAMAITSAIRSSSPRRTTCRCWERPAWDRHCRSWASCRLPCRYA
jgi:hypothetical protein